jgi:hypothetical protein
MQEQHYGRTGAFYKPKARRLHGIPIRIGHSRGEGVEHHIVSVLSETPTTEEQEGIVVRCWEVTGGCIVQRLTTSSSERSILRQR